MVAHGEWHSAWHMVKAPWHTVHGARSMAHVGWHTAHGTRHAVSHSTRREAAGTQRTARGAWHSQPQSAAQHMAAARHTAHGTHQAAHIMVRMAQHAWHSTRHMARGSWHTAHGTWFMAHGSRHVAEALCWAGAGARLCLCLRCPGFSGRQRSGVGALWRGGSGTTLKPWLLQSTAATKHCCFFHLPVAFK